MRTGVSATGPVLQSWAAGRSLGATDARGSGVLLWERRGKRRGKEKRRMSRSSLLLVGLN